MTSRRKQHALLTLLWKPLAMKLSNMHLHSLKLKALRTSRLRLCSKAKIHKPPGPQFNSTSRDLSSPMFPLHLPHSSLKSLTRMVKCRASGIRGLVETPSFTNRMRLKAQSHTRRNQPQLMCSTKELVKPHPPNPLSNRRLAKCCPMHQLNGDPGLQTKKTL